jgi:hypothetical protein
VKNGTWRAWAIVATLVAAISLTALYTSTDLRGNVIANTESILDVERDVERERKRMSDEMRWQRNAITAIAVELGVKLPEE